MFCIASPLLSQTCKGWKYKVYVASYRVHIKNLFKGIVSMQQYIIKSIRKKF